MVCIWSDGIDRFGIPHKFDFRNCRNLVLDFLDFGGDHVGEYPGGFTNKHL